MILLRRTLGEVLRRQRLRQGLTLRELSARARVSLGYLSEIERGRKEASSELLTSICSALGVPLSSILMAVSDDVALAELSDAGMHSSSPTGPVVADLDSAKVTVGVG